MFHRVVAGIYDFYLKEPAKAYGPQSEIHDRRYSLYKEWAAKTLYVERGIFAIVMEAAVILSGIAFLVSVAALGISAHGKSEKLKEAKDWIVRVVLISGLIFGVTGIVYMVQAFGLK